MAFLSKPVTSKYIETEENENLKVTRAEMNGWRKGMEDYCTVEIGGIDSFFAIYDGHNGKEASRFLQAKLVEKIKLLKDRHDPIELEKICWELDQEFLSDIYKRECGSTCCMAILNNTSLKLTIVNVGDSGLCVLRKKENTWQVKTQDHHPHIYPGEALRIKNAGGLVTADGRVNGRLALSRAFGNFTFKNNRDKTPNFQLVIPQPDITALQLEPGDTFLVYCDGITEACAMNLIAPKLQENLKTKSSEKILRHLLDFSLRVGSTDNMSCILIQLKEPESVIDCNLKKPVVNSVIGDDSDLEMLNNANLTLQSGTINNLAWEYYFDSRELKAGDDNKSFKNAFFEFEQRFQRN